MYFLVSHIIFFCASTDQYGISSILIKKGSHVIKKSKNDKAATVLIFNKILVANAPFIKNSNQMASRLTATASFSRLFFKLLQYSRQRPGFSPHRAALMTKTVLTFPEFSLRFVDFAFQFCFCCNFWFYDE